MHHITHVDQMLTIGMLLTCANPEIRTHKQGLATVPRGQSMNGRLCVAGAAAAAIAAVGWISLPTPAGAAGYAVLPCQPPSWPFSLQGPDQRASRPFALRGGGGANAGARAVSKHAGVTKRSDGMDQHGWHVGVVPALGMVVGATRLLAVPYVALLMLLHTTQRSILYQIPPILADPTSTGGRLIVLPASPALLRCAAVGGSAGGPNSARPTVAAVHFAPKDPDLPTLVYFHGNADQIGWGAAYIGMQVAERFGFGFFGVEYPGYGASRGLEATEESLYLGAEQLLYHLTSPWGLNVSESQTVLFGQSIGCAVAIEMASRGFGQRLVLLAPFESILQMAGAAFPLFKPGLRLCPWLVRDRFDNVAKARRLALPALVLHGSRDEVVPQRQGRKVRRHH